MTKTNYSILIKKDGKFYIGQCLEIPQARGQGKTKEDAIIDTKKAIRLSKSYLASKKKNANLVTVTV